jgi:D-arabinitol 4-dehydrogenase
MNKPVAPKVSETGYDRSACKIGVVHLGYGAFHRAHQAEYLDTYMDSTGDLSWGIAAVNLRASESSAFAELKNAHAGYLLKSVAPTGEISLTRIRSHVAFSDWAANRAEAENLLSQPSVKMVTITVTESGYYTDSKGCLDLDDPTISAAIAGQTGTTIYAYLAGALARRKSDIGTPITICCCDNIRQNGKMLKRNFAAYLSATGQHDLQNWAQSHVTFPCSMVDRITPRPTSQLANELSALTGETVTHPVMAEAFVQWVFEDDFATDMPDLGHVGVIVTKDVDPYEETKIRVLNGGHTCLAYLAALSGIETFDAAMRTPALFDHFWNYETKEVLPALTLALPFSETDYLASVSERFKNAAIGDTVARICADGVAKFPIFIRPTLEGCLKQGILPDHGIKSIASWYVFARHVAANKIPFAYLEPSWTQLSALLGTKDFLFSSQLWGNLPTEYPDFTDALRDAITEMEQSWPV